MKTSLNWNDIVQTIKNLLLLCQLESANKK